MTIRTRDRKRAEANNRKHKAIINSINPVKQEPEKRVIKQKQLTERERSALQVFGKYVKLPGVLGAVETLKHLDKMDQFIVI
jgi:hypothetical protein